MKRFMDQFAPFLLVVASLGLIAACRPSTTDYLDPADPELLQNLLHQADVCPDGYTLLEDANVLSTMGMNQNPDFIKNVSELEAMAKYGGTNPFLAVYGMDSNVCMMVNGVFFYDRDRMETFIYDQENRSRLRIAVYEKSVENGYWAVIFAIDPNRDYTPDEQAAIDDALARKSDHLETRLHFSRLWDDPN